MSYVAKPHMQSKLKNVLASNEALRKKELDAYGKAKSSNDKRREFIKSSFNDSQKSTELAEARKKALYLNWLADNTIMPFFEYIPLSNSEQPVLVSETDQDYNVVEINQHGMPASDGFVNLDSVNEYKMYEIVTDEVKYPIQSIQTGNLDVFDRTNSRVNYKMERKMNSDLWTLLSAALGSYPSGAWEKDSDITSSTLPSTNDVDVSSEGALTLEVFKNIANHGDLLNKKVRAILMNPTEKSDMYDWPVRVESGGTEAADLITEQMRDRILNDGTLSRLFGHDFEIILDNTLAKKYVWVLYEGPAGIFWEKPDMSRVIQFDEKDLMLKAKIQRMEAIALARTVKPLIPAPYRLNFARFQFAS